MHRSFTRILTVLALTLAIASPAAARAQVRQVESLEEILDVLGRLSSLYRDRALSFTCVERIQVIRYGVQDRIASRDSHRFDYYYVAENSNAGPQRSLNSGLRDYRMEIDSRGVADAEPVDLMAKGIPAATSRAYSWIFVFQPGLRDGYFFIQEPDDEVWGRDAWVIGFSPREPYYADLNDWFGRVWIDKSNFQLLRAEAAKSPDYVFLQDPRIPAEERVLPGRVIDQRNAADPGAQQGVAAPSGIMLFAHITTEFGQITNGLRFPTRTAMNAAYIDLGDATPLDYRNKVREILERGIRRDRLFRIEQRYDDYRFFDVHTATEVDATLRGVR